MVTGCQTVLKSVHVAATSPSRFLARIADPQGVRTVFEHVPGVSFFMKDDQEWHTAANSAALERFGIKSRRGLVGAMDEKVFPTLVFQNATCTASSLLRLVTASTARASSRSSAAD